MSAWSFNLRSSADLHQRLSDTSDDETPELAASNDDESQLLNNWDISSRHEEVVFKPNPWNIAKINAASRPSAPSRDVPLKQRSSISKGGGSMVVVKPHRGTLAEGFRKQLERQPQKFGANIVLKHPAFQRVRQTNPSQNLIEEASQDDNRLQPAGATAPKVLPDRSDFSFGRRANDSTATDDDTLQNTLARNVSHTDPARLFPASNLAPIPIPLPTDSASFSPLTPVTTTDAYPAADFSRSTIVQSSTRGIPPPAQIPISIQNSRTSPAVCPPGLGTFASSTPSAAYNKLRYVNQSSETPALTSAFLSHKIRKPIQFPAAVVVSDYPSLSTCSVNGAHQLPSEQPACLTQIPPLPPSRLLPTADPQVVGVVPGHTQRSPRGEDEYRRDATLCHTTTATHAYHQLNHVHTGRSVAESQGPACGLVPNGNIITARPRSITTTATIQHLATSSAAALESTSPSSDLDAEPIIVSPDSATLSGPESHGVVYGHSSSPSSPAGFHRSPLFARRQNSGSSLSLCPSSDGSARKFDEALPAVSHTLGSRSSDRPQHGYKTKATDAYTSLAHLDADPDESWSTLPVRKSTKAYVSRVLLFF
jgi:hypothetical protein